MSIGVGIGAPMVAVLEGAWAQIRARHPEVPAAVIVVGASSVGARGGLKLGHFAAMRWGDGQREEPGAGGRLPEVFVGGEGLVRGPAEVLATLLHEAAHGLADARGIKDTSRQGRWHNTKFKALAVEVGIAVVKDPRIDWSITCLPAATRDAYADTIAELGRVLRLHRAAEIPGTGKTGKPAPPACVCGCGRPDPGRALGARGRLDPLWGVRGRTSPPDEPTPEPSQVPTPGQAGVCW